MSNPEQHAFLIVLKAIKNGMTLKLACADIGIPVNAFYDLAYLSVENEEKYYAAQQIRSEILVEEIIDIADYEKDPQVARNRIAARQWYASKMKPKRFGERIDLNINRTVNIAGALEDAKSRLVLPHCSSDVVTTAQVIDNNNEEAKQTTDSESVSDDPTEIESITLDDLLK